MTGQSTGSRGRKLGRQHQDDQLSGQELEFLRRWRLLIDALAGDRGQKHVAQCMDWPTSTVSRHYAGLSLPGDKWLDELCNYLNLPRDQRIELTVLLRQARSARQARFRTSQVSGPDPAPSADPSPPLPVSPPATSPGSGAVRHVRRRHPRAAWIAAAAAAVAVTVVATVAWSPRAAAPAGVVGSYSGEGLEKVAIPVTSLTSSLAAAFRQGRTAGATSVAGFEFRVARDKSLCLTAADTGPSAGKNRDRVEITACRLAANQIWIPEQWEINGAAFTRLVSDRYQSMCLNADNRGGLRNGQGVQLWNCYPANNESWDFGDWYRNVQPGQRSYPVLLRTGRLCLDADKYDFRDGDSVNIWTQYAAPNQFWS